MKIKDFTIKKQDAYNFSKLSGDNNPIHLDNLKGYNSMYGKNITHGVLPVLNLLNKINFKYLTKSIDKFIIKIEFKKPIYYNKKISINLSNRELSKYFLYQNSILST
ncbi:MaoC/PaaZ C-terminal domain-containing protein, partial [Pelagibacteraceae bacterium]|nr:MaoC/PaaZ C-terminal domain-containing protein [Pelagibacteraceae bacterium]